MSTPKLCEKPCETCAKEGLPILLTRYSVLPKEANAPKLKGNLNNAEVAAITLSSEAHYGLRLLRTGYVYVYDEARKRMDEYFVTNDGFLNKLPMRQIMLKDSLHKPAADFQCARNGLAPMAGLISIPKPKYATTVWISYSDAAWTNLTYQQHRTDADLRKKHMQPIKISGGKVAAQSHTAPLEEVSQHVAEFNKITTISSFAKWSPFAFNKRIESDSFKTAIAKNAPEGGAAIVALHDPVGIAAELDALMEYALVKFNEIGDRKRGLALSRKVADIEGIVRSKAEESAKKNAQFHATQLQASYGMAVLTNPDLGNEIEKTANVSYAELKVKADKAWDEYTERFDRNKAKKWLNGYHEDLKKYDATVITPLAQAHAAWLKSTIMANKFKWNYDPTNIEQGQVYAEVLSICIGSTQDKKVCFYVYKEWLDGDVTDKDNLLLRAFALNHDNTAQDIKKAMTVSLDWRGFPLDGLVGSFGKAIESIGKYNPDVLGRLVVRLAGNFTRMMIEGADGKVRSGLVMLGLYTQKTFAVVNLTDTHANFRAALIEQLSELGQKYDVNPNKVKEAVRDELRRLKLAGVDLNSPQNKHLLVMIDEAHIKNMPAGLNAEARAVWVSKSIRTMEQYKALQQSNSANWAEKIRNPISKAARGSIPYITGLAQAYLQYAAYQKLSEDDGKAMNHELVEANYRLKAGGMALIGTLVDLAGKSLEAMGKTSLKWAVNLGVIGDYLTRFAKALGMGGAVIMAGFDVNNAINAFGKGQVGLGVLYLFSAGFGLGAAYFLTISMAASATGVGLVLVLLLIAITFWIEWIKDGRLKEWLSRTLWGKIPEYGSEQEETTQYNRAVA